MATQIDMTPTWSAIAGVLILALENGNEKGRQAAREELKRMAKIADGWNAVAQEATEVARESGTERAKALIEQIETIHKDCQK